VGKDADMIVVEGNPLDDIGVLTNPDNIKLVLNKGIIYKNILIKPED
jgi:imidazolonepropionase-like amidohydrolase